MHGWLAFILSYLSLAFAIFAPGYLVLRCISFDRKAALCAAPLVSAALIVAEGILYASLGIFANWIDTALLPVCLFLALFFLLKKHSPLIEDRPERLSSWMPLAFYIVVSLIFAIFMFAGNMDGAAAFQPDNDNATHLNLIKTMSLSGNYSILHTSSYLPGEISPHPNGEAGFYPAVFHAFAATSASLFSISAALAENALAAVIISLVYPLGFYLFFKSAVGRDDRRLLLSGAVAVPIVQSFPWKFLTWGPLFPNLLAFALIPAAFVLFSEALKRFGNHRQAIKWIVLFCIGAMAVAASHPNGLFTLAIFCAIYLIHFLLFDEGTVQLKPAGRRAAALIVVLLAAGCWVLLYRMPFMQNVVHFTWNPYLTNLADALIDVLSLKLTSVSASIVGSLLMLWGIYTCIRDWKRFGWMVIVFCFVAVQSIACAMLPGDSLLRHLLCGFWYNDPNRIAANVGLASVSLIACGLTGLLNLFAGKNVITADNKSNMARTGIEMGAVCGMFVFAFVVSHVAGGGTGFSLPTDATETTTSLIEYKYSTTTPKGYDLEEQQFVDKVLDIIPENALILNIPSDGSCFAYSIQNANVYWRTVVIGTETPEATLIRTRLVDITTDPEVKNAASSINAHYLLMLDVGADRDDLNRILPVYRDWQWEGLNTINETTPGFTLLLSQDDMRLYQIDY